MSSALSRRYFSLQYFYLLTEQGHLYHLFDPLPFIQHGKMPSGPAYLRNEKFLDFFFKNLHPTPSDLPHSKLFPFVSKCGKEGNFLAVPGVFAPIVFTDSVDGSNTATATVSSRTLKFAGSLTQELHPSDLREWEGRLYHPVPTEKIIRGLRDPENDYSLPKKHQRDRRTKVNCDEEGKNENQDITEKAASECVDPVVVEKILTDFNNGKFSKSPIYDSVVTTKVSKNLGLVSSSVAFDIGFNFIRDDVDEVTNVQELVVKKPSYVISLDGGVTEIPVKSLW